MRDRFVSAVALALAKFRFKHYSPVRETSDIKAIAEIWVDNLIAERVTQSEVTTALDWLMANKPEFPDIADVLERVRRKRSKDYARLMEENIAIERSPGVIGIVARNSPEGMAELAAREVQSLPSPDEMEFSKASLKASMEKLGEEFERRKREYVEPVFVEDEAGKIEAKKQMMKQVEGL